MRRRLVILVLLFLIAGAVVQTGVAWVICWQNDKQRVMSGPVVWYGMPGHPSVDQVEWPVSPPSAWRDMRDWRVSSHEHAMGVRVWVASGMVGSGALQRDLDLINARYGLPWHGLQVTHHRDRGNYRVSPDERDQRIGLPIPSWLPQMRHWPHRLPIHPIWPGFVLNTLVYAAGTAVMWGMFMALRRHRRQRTGCCLRCGYSLAGLAPAAACPECGRPGRP